MAIEAVYLTLLTKAVQLLRRRTGDDRRLATLALSYPDLVVPEAALQQILGPQIMQDLPQRADAAQIWQWHGLQGATDPLYDSLSVFDRLGLDVTVIDIVAARGNERIVDLNEPLPDDLRNRFDFVIDTGTCEHCFNVGMAFRNACEAVGQNGYLLHAAPLNRYNHGFWSFNPTVYADYFRDNGFSLRFISGVECKLADGFSTFPINLTGRFGKVPDNAALYVLAERVEVRPQVWPMQHKYRT